MSLAPRTAVAGVELQAPVTTNGFVMPTPRGRNKLVSFRLSEIPPEIRISAAKDELGDGVTPLTLNDLISNEVGLAAVAPSDEIYWISYKAYMKVMRNTLRQREKAYEQQIQDRAA